VSAGPAIAALALVVAIGCGGSARRGEPIAGPLVLTSEAARRGERVFMEHCHSCHPGGEGGVGPALNNKPAPRFLIGLQVRQGLGAMPAFPPDRIDDRALDDLVDYVVALRRHGG
jgi:mono/diheme cytochrome c family protein